MKKLRKAYIALIMAFLYAPILLLILYSFNDSKSRANWGGFTLRWYKELFSDAAIMSALGTTLSAGFFLLPGIAATQAGPAVILSYLVAAVPLIPAMLSVVELATAMPRAGGAYYFLDRSMGPLAGTIGGLGTAVIEASSFKVDPGVTASTARN